MQRKQMNKLAMYRNLHQLYSGEISLVIEQTVISELFQELEETIQQIIRTSVAKSKPVQRSTQMKREAKTHLFEQGHLAYSLLYAAGMALENQPLIEVLKKHAITGKNIADEDLIRRAIVIAEEADGLENKAPYMLSDEFILELRTAIDEFTTLIGEPRKTIISRKMLGQTLHLLFVRTDRMLREKLDKLMLFAAKDNPELLEKYKSSRMVVDITATRKSNLDQESIDPALDDDSSVEDKRLDEEAPPTDAFDEEEGDEKS